MLAGWTQSGKKVFACHIVRDGRPKIINPKKFNAQDHFDSLCIFYFMAIKELKARGPSEFYDHYKRLQELHRAHVIILTEANAGPKELPLGDYQVIANRGQMLAAQSCES